MKKGNKKLEQLSKEQQVVQRDQFSHYLSSLTTPKSKAMWAHCHAQTFM
jgi:hypothetical protein